MKNRVQGCVTAGVAVVGAGVMAATPIAQQAPEVLRSVNADVELAAYNGTPAQNLALSAQRALTSLAGSPLGLIPAAQALVDGDNEALYTVLQNYIDGPLYVADPAIYALDDLLPAPIGGDPANEPTQRGDSLITQFRADTLIGARDDIREAVADSLGVGTEADVDNEGPVYAVTRLGAGLAVSGVRAARSAALAPLGVVAIAQGLQQSYETGDNTALYTALESYIDAPQYIADPVVFAVDDVLPQPIGSDPATDPTQMNGSEVSNFRANTLLGVRDQVRGVVKNALGVDQNNAAARTLSADATDTGSSTSDRPTGPIRRVTESLKAIPGGGVSTDGTSSTAGTGGKHRALSGPLSNLFKKHETKTDTSSGSNEPESNESSSTD
ncbi:hypothetical protein DVS77_13340 [Mycolicibacterium moriokaense]|nr:hypothetical protein DVS77_13340 [Mycolicibacterium moriokaense]